MSVRVSFSKELEFDEKEGWRYKKVKHTSQLDPITRIYGQPKKEIVGYEDLSTEGLSKEIIFDLVISRTALNPRTNLNVDAFFVQKVKASIPREKARKHHYLSMVSQLLFLHDLLHQLTVHVCIHGEATIQHPDVEFMFVNKPKRLTREQASKLLKKPSTYRYVLPENEGKFGLVNLANY